MLTLYRLLVLLLLIIIMHENTFCQIGEVLTYRTQIKDSLNTPLLNERLLVKLSIVNNNGHTIYSEKHDNYTDSAGVLRLHVGEGAVMQGEFDNIYWDKGIYFIIVQNDTTALDGQISFISMHEIFRMHYPIHNAEDSFYLGKYSINGKSVYMYLSGELNKLDTVNHTLDNVVLEDTNSTIILPVPVSGKAKDKTQKQLNVHELPEGWYIPTIENVPLLFYQRYTSNVKKHKQRFTFVSFYYVMKDFNVSYIKLLPPPTKW